MIKKSGEYQPKNRSSQGEHFKQQEHSRQQQQNPAERRTHGEKTRNKFYGRNNSGRRGSQNRFNSNKNTVLSMDPMRVGRKEKTEETVDDIKMDINRIEKEIQLELKEIRSIKL
ncbi:MAG: hypothetical protein ACOX7R_01100 [Acetivibrionales bacterium]|jgi:hypothetical protein